MKINIRKLKKEIEKEQKKHITNYGIVDSLFNYIDGNFITNRGHFHIKFKNGYEISLINGKGSYTDNIYNQKTFIDATQLIWDEGDIGSYYMEIAIIKKNKFVTRDFIDTDDDVAGMLTPEEIIDIIYKVKEVKNAKQHNK